MESDLTRVIYSVSALNREARFILSEHFGGIWVAGEISNLACPSSGHVYFTLKDADAQVRCAMFRAQARGLAFRPENGRSVVVRAQVGLYEPRGDYQLVVEYMEEAGDGALRRAFDELKRKLAGEGLFEAERKRPIPLLPQGIGVITSPTGAAIRDVLTVLARRFPALPVIVFPVKVQGNEAKQEIAQAIARADRLQLCEVILLVRGGGSLEDLWAFNEEIVARTIAHCSIPIISGVGHETDFTIADLVADVRAPTPSAAAEAVSPDWLEWLAGFQRFESQLRKLWRERQWQRQQRLEFLEKRLQHAHPEKRLQAHAQRLDELELRLQRASRTMLAWRANRLATAAIKMQPLHPRYRLETLTTACERLDRRLTIAVQRLLERQFQQVNQLGQQLHMVSPLATLERGYAITTRAQDNKILRRASEVVPGERIATRLAEGVLISRIEDSSAGDGS